MPRSMTGYGSADGTVHGGRLRIEIRTVNHRFFNPQLKLPQNLTAVESEIRERLRQTLDRGHITVSARWIDPPPVEREVAVDVTRARLLINAMRELKKKLKLKGDVDLAFVARQPEVLSFKDDEETPVVWDDVRVLVDRAVSDVQAMREREGLALTIELRARLDALEAGAAQIEARAPARLTAELDRLKKAVAELASGLRVDEQRLALEIALLADRVDITEELVRFRTHVAACRAALAGTGAPVGKQLGFLGQELLREINTMGSKANDAVITQVVIAMKGEVEKFREQLENLE
jgi:uncharacterized protein (TIGR00255 family)